MKVGKIILKNLNEAMDIIDSLRTLISKYGYATIADLYNIIGITPSNINYEHGWTNIEETYIKNNDYNYFLYMPEAILLDVYSGKKEDTLVSQKKDTTSFSVPNEDTYVAPYTICKKEVLQKSYIDTIGKTINYLGTTMKVTGVTITEKYITVILE
jgi:hypothetical protein